jgi:hypothetical protein
MAAPSRPLSQPPIVERLAPLRSATVAQRALEARAAEPNVVQVTIDRIDVRMPSGKAVEQRSAQPRPREPAISLSDYLRRRAPDAGGGR